MIQNDIEFKAMQERIAWFESILLQIRTTARPDEFQAMSGGYRCELKKMQEEVLEYLSRLADEPQKVVA